MTRAKRLKGLAAYLPRRPGAEIELTPQDQHELTSRMQAFRQRLERRRRKKG